jgi:hypothetical protein
MATDENRTPATPCAELLSRKTNAAGTPDSIFSSCTQTTTPGGDVVNHTTVDTLNGIAGPEAVSKLTGCFDAQLMNVCNDEMETDGPVAPPGGGEFNNGELLAIYNECRVRFTLETCSDSDTDRDDDDVTTRDRPAPLLPKESHPSKDQTVRRAAVSRLITSSDKSDNHSAATCERSDNCLDVTGSRFNNVSLQLPPEPPLMRCPSLLLNGQNKSLQVTSERASISTLSSTTNAKLQTQRVARSSRPRPSSALRKEIKAAKQLGVIMGAFTVCFLPYFVCFTVVAFCADCVNSQLMTGVTWIGYLNSTLNPFLYPLCNANFRRKFRQMLECVSQRRPTSVTARNFTWLSLCTCEQSQQPPVTPTGAIPNCY